MQRITFRNVYCQCLEALCSASSFSSLKPPWFQQKLSRVERSWLQEHGVSVEYIQLISSILLLQAQFSNSFSLWARSCTVGILFPKCPHFSTLSTNLPLYSRVHSENFIDSPLPSEWYTVTKISLSLTHSHSLSLTLSLSLTYTHTCMHTQTCCSTSQSCNG